MTATETAAPSAPAKVRFSLGPDLRPAPDSCPRLLTNRRSYRVDVQLQDGRFYTVPPGAVVCGSELHPTTEGLSYFFDEIEVSRVRDPHRDLELWLDRKTRGLKDPGVKITVRKGEQLCEGLSRKEWKVYLSSSPQGKVQKEFGNSASRLRGISKWLGIKVPPRADRLDLISALRAWGREVS